MACVRKRAKFGLVGIVFGAAPAATPRLHENPYTAFLNGRIEDPAIMPGVHDASAALEPDADACAAYWDFSQEITSDRILDRGPYALHGTLRNLPTRAVCGSRWTGEETAWRHRPRHYAAIHFHEDDLDDCGASLRWKCYRASACRSGGPRSAPGSLASRQRDTLAAEYQRIRGF